VAPLAGIQAVVRWQVSQAAVVVTWPVVGLARAGGLAPLWQLAHCPGVTLAWPNVAPMKLLVPRWQVSQVLVPAKLWMALLSLARA
jgi:hypothetical protein